MGAGKLNAGGNPAMHQHPVQGGVEILLVASCKENWDQLLYDGPLAVLSISFEVDVSTGKVGGSLHFECRRRELPRGVWGQAPPENFEI